MIARLAQHSPPPADLGPDYIAPADERISRQSRPTVRIAHVAAVL